MVYDPSLVDSLEDLARIDWAGEVFRFMSGDRLPDRQNTMGARWNPPDVPAIYTALEWDTLQAEFHHALRVRSPSPDPTKFTFYRVRLAIVGIVDLCPKGVLDRLDVDYAALVGDSHKSCRAVGGAAHWLGAGGLLVPSARRAEGTNLVVFPDRQPPDYPFEVIQRSRTEEP